MNGDVYTNADGVEINHIFRKMTAKAFNHNLKACYVPEELRKIMRCYSKTAEQKKSLNNLLLSLKTEFTLEPFKP